MSHSLVDKIVKIFSWILMGVSALVALLFYTNSISEAPYIIWAYVLVGLASAMALVFPIIYFVNNPKNAIKALVGIGALGLIFLIGYLVADTTPIVTATSELDPNFSDPTVLRLADTGLIMTYILMFVAVLALLLTGIRSLINR